MAKDNKKIPGHVGIIPDGNRRWAKSHGLQAIQGHERGFRQVKEIADKAFDLGVEVLSIWGFSTENWDRNQVEIDYLMSKFVQLIKEESVKLNEKNIKLIVSGRRDRLPIDLVKAIETAETLTVSNSAGTVNLCLDYGGRQELLETVNKLLKQKKSEVTFEDIVTNLYHQLPDLDLIIRTSGEQRLSGFMPWQGVYSELLFIDKHWPEFGPDDLAAAVLEYGRRERRFGGD